MRMSKDFARTASSLALAPSPTRPRVEPASSPETGVYITPARRLLEASVEFFASASMKNMACSASATALNGPGVFANAIPLPRM